MEKISQNPSVVFVCEHGAAKSIIAAVYFNKLARGRGSDHHAIARGTNPDTELSQSAVIGLRKDGLTPDLSTPQQLSVEELQKDTQVIAFCKLPERFGDHKTVEYWDDVPPVSEDYERARDSILTYIKQLIDFQ